MLKIISYFFIFISLALANEKQNIIDVLDQYNKAFGKADYSNIAKCFDYPAYFNLQDKTIGASGKFKLKLIYRKIRGDLPDYYSYSKWDKIDIELIDESIAIVNASYYRYKDDNTVFDSGKMQYHMRLIGKEWKIFSLTPFTEIKSID
ncbi:MAG: hypothetical protein CMG61_02335 [Candidatus Marinimicrobia bacterium]|nr:hypothetical protein [Candidatus Neomarinimicrobiota bacterium]